MIASVSLAVRLAKSSRDGETANKLGTIDDSFEVLL